MQKLRERFPAVQAAQVEGLPAAPPPPSTEEATAAASSGSAGPTVGSKRKLPTPVPWRKALKEEQEKAQQSAVPAVSEPSASAARETEERAWYSNVEAKTDAKHRSGSMNKMATLAVQYENQNWQECTRLIAQLLG